MNRAIVAYSGGLYSSLVIHWLRHKRGTEVVAFIAKIGQPNMDLERVDQIREWAMRLGADQVIIADLVDEFVHNYIFPTLRTDACYEGKYYFSMALSRPLIVREMVNNSLDYDCDLIAHGAYPEGNDFLRFETIVASLSVDLELISPWRKWNIQSLEDALRYVKRHNLDFLPLTKDTERIDENLWGRTVKLKRFLPMSEPVPSEVYAWTTEPKEAPDEEEVLTIEFHKGVPIRLNGKEFSRKAALIQELNRIGGRHGVGRMEGIENLLTGVKSREIYEAPAAVLLTMAHQTLEDLTLPKDLLRFQAVAAKEYADHIYRGLWFSELREALDTFFITTQEYVSGKVTLRLYKGRCEVVSCESPHSLYRRPVRRGRALLKGGPATEFPQIPIMLQDPVEAESAYIEEK